MAQPTRNDQSAASLSDGKFRQQPNSTNGSFQLWRTIRIGRDEKGFTKEQSYIALIYDLDNSTVETGRQHDPTARLDRIVSYCRFDGISDDVAEGINSEIQSIQRRVGGFRNTGHYQTAIYFYCGAPDLNPTSSVKDQILDLETPRPDTSPWQGKCN